MRGPKPLAVVLTPTQPAAPDQGVRRPQPVRPPDQPVDGAGDCRRDYGAGHRRPDLRPSRRPAAQKGGRQPHRWRSWLTPADDADCDTKVTDICTLYQQAPALTEQG